jgi:hypothetical protein
MGELAVNELLSGSLWSPAGQPESGYLAPNMLLISLSPRKTKKTTLHLHCTGSLRTRAHAKPIVA